MKVVFISQNDPLYTKHFFDRFLEVYSPEDFELIGIFFLQTMNDSTPALIKRTLSFYGLNTFIKIAYAYLLKMLAARLGFATTAYKLMQKHGFYVEKIRNVNDSEFIHWLKAHKTDLIISISAPQIFKEKLLTTPKYGCVNIHSGKIPSYRGLFPNFWQMYNGEKHSTVSIHKMEKKIDKGNLIMEFKVPITKGMRLTQLIKQTKYKAAEAISPLVKNIARGKVRIYENNLKESYYKFPSRADVKEFYKRGYRI